MKDKVRYIIYPGDDTLFQFLFSEAAVLSNVNICSQMFIMFDRHINSLWRKLEYHGYENTILMKIYEVVVTMFSNVWRVINRHEETCILLSNIAVSRIGKRNLKRLEKAPNVKLVLYLLDSISQPNCRRAKELMAEIKFDLVYTFDEFDSQKYGYKHFYTMYSMTKMQKKDIQYDLIFIGTDKGRLPLLLKISDICSEYGCNNYFDIINVKDEKLINQYKDKIVFNHILPYTETIKLTQRSNCILDIVVEQQAGLSLRALEAICYNKRLLTNNPTIRKFPFYNEKYMKVISKPEDINIEFIRNTEEVDYGYCGEYSPVTFLNRVQKELYD